MFHPVYITWSAILRVSLATSNMADVCPEPTPQSPEPEAEENNMADVSEELVTCENPETEESDSDSDADDSKDLEGLTQLVTYLNDDEKAGGVQKVAGVLGTVLANPLVVPKPVEVTPEQPCGPHGEPPTYSSHALVVATPRKRLAAEVETYLDERKRRLEPIKLFEKNRHGLWKDASFEECKEEVESAFDLRNGYNPTRLAFKSKKPKNWRPAEAWHPWLKSVQFKVKQVMLRDICLMLACDVQESKNVFSPKLAPWRKPSSTLYFDWHAAATKKFIKPRHRGSDHFSKWFVKVKRHRTPAGLLFADSLVQIARIGRGALLEQFRTMKEPAMERLFWLHYLRKGPLSELRKCCVVKMKRLCMKLILTEILCLL